MNIRTEVREIEKHINNLSLFTKEEKIKIISIAQGLSNSEYAIMVFSIVKSRIIHS